MNWRSWLVGCLVAGLVGVVLGTVHAGLTGSGEPVRRSGFAPAEAAGLPVPREQPAVRTPAAAVPRAVGTGRGKEAEWGGGASEHANRPKPAKAAKAGSQGIGKHRDDHGKAGRDDRRND